jgi:hypothetical protein
MPPILDVDINPRFKALNLKIMFICNIQHLTHWMWWLGVNMLLIGTMGDSKKVGTCFNKRDCDYAINDGAHIAPGLLITYH